MREAVVLVHGIWLTGVEFVFLKRQLRNAGYDAWVFHYHSLLRTPEQNAGRLNQFIASIDADIVHIVAHSLGGVVVSHLFSEFPVQRPGQIVMLATPMTGSSVAQAFSRVPILRWALGRSTRRGLLGNAPRWKGTRRLAVIAGTRGLGVWMLLFGGLDRPNDGTVSVAETQGDGVHLHMQVPYSHFGMLFSSRVAEVVLSLLAGE